MATAKLVQKAENTYRMAQEIPDEEILNGIKAHDFKPVYMLMGEEPYFIDQLTEAIVSNALPEEERDFCLTTF